jgi:hypothetical protein
LIVDSGNFSDNPTPLGDLKTGALLEAMQMLDYGVVNVGERDVKHGYAKFAERVGETQLNFVSANIIDKATGEPIFEPHVVVEAAASDGGRKLRIGVIGVVRFNPIFQEAGPGESVMAIAHPKERIEAELAKLKQQEVDMVLLLAALHHDDAVRIVNEVEGIDFVVGSYGGYYTTRSEQVGQTWLLYSGNQGKRVGDTRVFLAPDGGVTDQRTRLHLLSSRYPSDDGMLAFRVAAREKAQQVSPVRPVVTGSTTTGPYVGTSSCRKCHEQAHDQWSGTAHASAFETLEREKKASERLCRTCHTTGAGQAGGFQSAATTPQLLGVGCESCHGAGLAHAGRPRKGYGEVSVGTCIVCHDTKHSPKFDYYSYLPQVTHTGRAARIENP